VLKAGLLVERFPKREVSVKEFAQNELKGLKASNKFKVRGEPELKEISLADGTKALLLRAQFLRLENGRLSTQCKVYCSDSQGRYLVATSFITCSPPAGSFVKGISLDQFLEAHATSLVVDPAKVDLAGLKGTYDKLDPQVGVALQRASDG